MSTTVDEQLMLLETPGGGSVKDDLDYWRQKLEYAETCYGQKAVDLQTVARSMLDLYLDRFLKEKKALQL